jgi:hypothetical protein
MQSVILVNSEGEILQSVLPRDVNDWPIGGQLDGHDCMLAPFEITSLTQATKWLDGTIWKDRIARPGTYYNWLSGVWVLDSDMLSAQLTLAINAKLAATDWTQAADAPLTDIQRLVWTAYRQAVRDIPTNITHLDEVVWP